MRRNRRILPFNVRAAVHRASRRSSRDPACGTQHRLPKFEAAFDALSVHYRLASEHDNETPLSWRFQSAKTQAEL
jgi:hypothetical protein